MSTHNGLRIVFAGTPEFAAHHLAALLQSEHQVVAVYTQPDRPSGRGKKLAQSPVKQLALINGLAVEQPMSLRDEEAQATLAAYQADVMVVVAYGLLLPQAILDTPRYGCINVHGSLLPRWRGAAPIQRAIASGDKTTGITTMQMEKGLDTGPMLMHAELPIEPDDTSASLHDKLMELGAKTLLQTLSALKLGALSPEIQDDAQANYAEKITKEEANIDWSQDAQIIERLIRAYNPFPIAYTHLNGERLKIYQAEVVNAQANQPPGTISKSDGKQLLVACGNGQLAILKAQLPGKKPLPIDALLNGYHSLFVEGDRLKNSV